MDTNEIERALRRILENEDAARPSAQNDEAAKVQQVWNELAVLKSQPDYAALLGRPTLRERLVSGLDAVRSFGTGPVYAAIASAAAVAAIVLLVKAPSNEPGSERFATQIAETRDVVLKDGTHIALGPKSAMEVSFTADERRVSVTPGESYFEVASNPERPFVVTAGDTRITVVGTKFNVKYDNNVVRVAVVEGLVKVIPHLSAPGSAAASVPAGNEAIVSRTAERAVVESIDLSFPPDSWRTGQLYYDDVSLDEIVFDLNRHLRGNVRIDSATLGQARLTTSFPAGQAVQFLEGLPSLLPLEVQHRADGEFVLVDAAAESP